MTVRITPLNAAGNPTGTMITAEHVTLTMEPLDSAMLAQHVLSYSDAWRRFNVTIQLMDAATKTFLALMLGHEAMMKRRRAARHRARIVVVPRRRRKHGRIGVYR